ncbi:MAG: hypothetical protein IKM61_01225 [Eubacteriaceae bacterium]|nr:hypothetical protein [Eubacteriaceae bacterium]
MTTTQNTKLTFLIAAAVAGVLLLAVKMMMPQEPIALAFDLVSAVV